MIRVEKLIEVKKVGNRIKRVIRGERVREAVRKAGRR